MDSLTYCYSAKHCCPPTSSNRKTAAHYLVLFGTESSAFILWMDTKTTKVCLSFDHFCILSAQCTLATIAPVSCNAYLVALDSI